jgi:DNA-binding transcriptional MerR regulator
MKPDELMTIGRFARLSGVSVHALRHYDDVGLLVPAHVDAASGYRRYAASQLRLARLIRALRWNDLPIDGIRLILTDIDARAGARSDAGDGAATRDVLARHRDRLERQSSLIAAQLRDVTRFLDEGLDMPVMQSGCRPVQVKSAVDDTPAAVAFYQKLLGARYEVAQRTSHGDHSCLMFGQYGRGDFFLYWLLDDRERLDLPGRSNVGFAVDDLEAAYQRALAAGANEAAAPHDADGMPRSCAVTDPWGNWVSLFEGESCRPVQLMIGVEDTETSAAFYSAAFGLSYQVTRRTPEAEYSSLVFGEYGRADFFMLWLLDDRGRLDFPGRSNFSFLVDDLDVVHQRALAAGATELAAPHDTEGMPRNSAVIDPSGNWVGLAQG